MRTDSLKTIWAVIGADPSSFFATSIEASLTASSERTCLFLVIAVSLATAVVARLTFSSTENVFSTQVAAWTWNDRCESHSLGQRVVNLTAFWNPVAQEIACQRTSSVVICASRVRASRVNAPFLAIAFLRANGVAETRAGSTVIASTHPASTATASWTANVFVNAAASGSLSSCHSKHPCASLQNVSRFSPPLRPWPLPLSSFSHLPLRL
mmetsp:Transcript_36368/g.96696  ORF Transcript_36368/g.96696 Transcript_36368/m.96696 type:complete len:211 (-) Transcript_36368:629-1261(-)